MTKEEYVLLYEKCASGNCTEAEKGLLEEYEDDFFLNSIPFGEDEESEMTERIYRRLLRNMRPENRSRSINWFQRYRLEAVAAMIFMFLGSGLYYFYLKDPGRLFVSGNESTFGHDIRPGTNKAVLTLSDGSQLPLNNAVYGIVARQGNARLRKLKDGQLVYDLSETSSVPYVEDTNQALYNSITTPRNGEYQLLLPDGTKVWLNAESSLRFPAVFTGSERRVELSGEAYFEVAKNREMPFRVIAGKTEIEVLGTHFNVNAYKEGVKTTLLEGSVKLKKDGDEILLQPGQSGIRSEHGAFTVEDELSDVEEVVDWKNGYFIFQDENIRSIMEKAARWYDVEVEYLGDTEDKNFWGKVSRYENISELLKNLELTGTIHFKIEGRKIIVMP
jgi:transmembrane sensor